MRRFYTIQTLFWGCLASLISFKWFFSGKKYHNWHFKGLIFLCPGETFTVRCHRTGAFLHTYNAKHLKLYLFSLLGYITNKKQSNFHQVYLNCSLTGWRNIKIKYSFSTIPKTVPNAYFGYNFCIWLKIGALNASF